MKANKRIKCPGCGDKGGKSLLEVWTAHTISFDQDDEGNIDPVGWMGDGHPYYVMATCVKCGKEWRIRGAKQIINLAGHPEYQPRHNPKKCLHSKCLPAFDLVLAQNMTSEEVRKHFPRFQGQCPDCFEQVIMYADAAQYIMGDY